MVVVLAASPGSIRSCSLVAIGEITEEQAAGHEMLDLVGMVGSIDNDMCGVSMTIGADTALHRIVDAIDALLTYAIYLVSGPSGHMVAHAYRVTSAAFR